MELSDQLPIAAICRSQPQRDDPPDLETRQVAGQKPLSDVSLEIGFAPNQGLEQTLASTVDLLFLCREIRSGDADVDGPQPFFGTKQIGLLDNILQFSHVASKTKPFQSLKESGGSLFRLSVPLLELFQELAGKYGNV